MYMLLSIYFLQTTTSYQLIGYVSSALKRTEVLRHCQSGIAICGVGTFALSSARNSTTNDAVSKWR